MPPASRAGRRRTVDAAQLRRRWAERMTGRPPFPRPLRAEPPAFFPRPRAVARGCGTLFELAAFADTPRAVARGCGAAAPRLPERRRVGAVPAGPSPGAWAGAPGASSRARAERPSAPRASPPTAVRAPAARPRAPGGSRPPSSGSPGASGRPPPRGRRGRARRRPRARPSRPAPPRRRPRPAPRGAGGRGAAGGRPPPSRPASCRTARPLRSRTCPAQRRTPRWS